jgi:hypothetical protein
MVLHRVTANDTLSSGILNASSALPFLDYIKFAGALGKTPYHSSHFGVWKIRDADAKHSLVT